MSPPRSNSWLTRLGGAALGLALLAAAQTAEATVITRTFNFTASGFRTPSGPAAPVDPVTGSVTVTWDNAANIATDQTAGVTVNSLNFPHGTVGINYDTGSDERDVGDTLNGVAGWNPGTTDFLLAILGSSTATPDFVFFGYTTIANTGFFTTRVPAA